MTEHRHDPESEKRESHIEESTGEETLRDLEPEARQSADIKGGPTAVEKPALGLQ